MKSSFGVGSPVSLTMSFAISGGLYEGSVGEYPSFTAYAPSRTLYNEFGLLQLLPLPRFDVKTRELSAIFLFRVETYLSREFEVDVVL
jgi:hypothetical protein